MSGSRSSPGGMIQKCTHDGSKLLQQIGRKGVFDTSDGTIKGTPLNSNAARFTSPASIQVDRQNGDIYIADGESRGGNSRVLVLDANGNLLRAAAGMSAVCRPAAWIVTPLDAKDRRALRIQSRVSSQHGQAAPHIWRSVPASDFPDPAFRAAADRSRAGSAGRLHGLDLGANSGATSWRQASGSSDDRLRLAPG